MDQCRRTAGPRMPVRVLHRIQCHHQVEVEVWPVRAEVYYSDERYVDPANTQVRFAAAVYNAPTERVSWAVLDLAGNPGAGSIDAGGLYRAPPKGGRPAAFTETIVVRSLDDPLRSARVWVTVMGEGPLPAPAPRLEIAPKRALLYYPLDANEPPSYSRNDFIDASNKMQLYRAWLRDSPAVPIRWRVNGDERHTGVEPFFLLDLMNMPPGLREGVNGQVVRVRAELAGTPTVGDEARLVLLNYAWPRNPA